MIEYIARTTFYDRLLSKFACFCEHPRVKSFGIARQSATPTPGFVIEAEDETELRRIFAECCSDGLLRFEGVTDDPEYQGRKCFWVEEFIQD